MSPPPTATVDNAGATTAFTTVHSDILESHILTRLDGPTLAHTCCTSSTLHTLSSQPHLWSHICHSTWPSTHRLRPLISNFPNGGPRAFFSLAFPILTSTVNKKDPSTPTAPPELISAVDIHYQNVVIFSRVQCSETVTGWFQCSPFRIDVLDTKDVVSTKIHHPESDDKCGEIMSDMSLSWILIDPTSLRAVNLSSFKPVSVQRHWLSGEVQVRFVTIVTESVQCEIVVSCGGSRQGGEMQVREVCMEMEDMEGVHLNGKDSLVILQRAFGCVRGKGVGREEEGRRRYREYEERRKERRERKIRTERAFDIMCVVFGLTAFATFCMSLFC